ncbi:hypothetical protein FOWG_18092 [Fusarium oxysporum f. sp. lycopersici MN25]|nr:hypothetical protein FOWG_18092 [Fusarium oxysporum f. sp. lycopersici MN25]
MFCLPTQGLETVHSRHRRRFVKPQLWSPGLSI